MLRVDLPSLDAYNPAMTRNELEAVDAISRLNMNSMMGVHRIQVIKFMNWACAVALREPDIELTPARRNLLYYCVWHYRKRIGLDRVLGILGGGKWDGLPMAGPKGPCKTTRNSKAWQAHLNARHTQFHWIFED